MNSMNNWATQAVEKLTKEAKTVAGQKEKAMSSAVMAALKDFCKQDEEFAQAIVQGGTFADCMKKVAHGVGNSISDLDAYKKAVQFYFPGAKVRMQLSIDLIGDVAGKPEKKQSSQPVTTHPEQKTGSSMILNLADFF